MPSNIVKLAKEKGVNLLLPLGSRCGDKYDPDCNVVIANVEEGNSRRIYGDLTSAPARRNFFADAVKDAGTAVWNGPMGVSEWPRFANGTIAVAKALADSNAISIIGGGDSAAAVVKSSDLLIK